VKTVGVLSVTTSEPAKAGGPAETCVFADGSVGTVLLGWEPVGTGNWNGTLSAELFSGREEWRLVPAGVVSVG